MKSLKAIRFCGMWIGSLILFGFSTERGVQIEEGGSRSKNEIHTLYWEQDHPMKSAAVHFVMQLDHDSSVEKKYYTLNYTENDWQGFINHFNTVKQSLLGCINQNVKYNLTCYVIGGEEIKPLLAFFEKQWDEFPVAILHIREEPKYESTLYLPSKRVSIPKLVFTLDAEKIPFQTIEGLKKRWMFAMVRELSSKLFQQILSNAQIQYECKDEVSFLSNVLRLHIFAEIPCQLSIWAQFKNEIDFLLREGFHEKGFESLKEQWIANLEQGYSNDVRNLSSFLLEQNPFENELLSYDEFLSSSLEVLRNIQCQDLKQVLAEFFHEENQSFQIFYPIYSEERVVSSENSFSRQPKLSQREACRFEAPHAFSSDHSNLGESDSSQTYGIDAYYDLPISETDKKIARKIITTMAEKNVFQLLMEKKSLEKMGKKIRHLHPMKFVGFLLNDHELKKCLKSISKSYFKWSNFLDGFEDRMKEESKKGQLIPYVPGFADALKVDPEVITHYIHKGKYEEIVNYCL